MHSRQDLVHSLNPPSACAGSFDVEALGLSCIPVETEVRPLGVRQQPLNVAFAWTRIDLQLRKLAEKSTAGMMKPASTRRSICQEPGRAMTAITVD
jgi:hypothetical protein